MKDMHKVLLYDVAMGCSKQMLTKNTRAEKSYISRVPYLHYGAVNTKLKNNETLI